MPVQLRPGAHKKIYVQKTIPIPRNCFFIHILVRLLLTNIFGVTKSFLRLVRIVSITLLFDLCLELIQHSMIQVTNSESHHTVTIKLPIVFCDHFLSCDNVCPIELDHYFFGNIFLAFHIEFHLMYLPSTNIFQQKTSPMNQKQLETEQT